MKMELFSDGLTKDHILAGTDARLKLLVATGILVMVLTNHGFIFPLFVAAVSLLLCIQMRVPVKLFLLRFTEPALVAFVLILIKFFFSGGDELFSISLFGVKIAGCKDGLIDGLTIATRIIGAVSVITVLGFATPFTEVIAALSWFRVPKGLIEILMFAYRYIFMLFEDAMVIYNAQKNRLGYSNVRRGLSSFSILAGSLTLKAFEHSQSTAAAMAQRGYDGNMPILKHRPFKLSEVIVSVLLIVIMGFAWKL
jgi:cobalt/nickel transport system permease protein